MMQVSVYLFPYLGFCLYSKVRPRNASEVPQTKQSINTVVSKTISIDNFMTVCATGICYLGSFLNICVTA